MHDYLKDVTVSDSWRMLSENPNCQLIDVRTNAEWQYVGFPDLSSIGKEVIFQEWQSFPGMQINSDFARNIMRVIEEKGGDTSTQLLFLCRSGVRSQGAASSLTAEGFGQCMNVIGGFEGPPDDAKHRGKIDGWKARDLPWRQN